jgi:hypothetical protein
MSEETMQIIEALPVGGPTWIEVVRWDAADSEYDADGWLDKWGERIGGSLARLPDGGWIDLSHFAAIRPANKCGK